ncbi:MAG: hypothetical protein SVV67_10405 [Bacillota bacterium]|nr:hypothetical protein [Bacillota bacterium]
MSENLMSNDYTRFAVPISRFEKGETEKIFEELKKTGIKAVVKNGLPCGIILSLEALKDFSLLLHGYQEKIYGEDPITKNALQEFAAEVELLEKSQISNLH